MAPPEHVLAQERFDLLLDEEKLPRTRGIALLAARGMAATEGWDNAMHLDTLALALFENGDIEGAIATQERAIALLGDDVDASYRERLERFRRSRR